MSDLHYNIVWVIGNHIFWASSRPTIINREMTRRQGAYILASIHLSSYDAPLLIRHNVRKVDFLGSADLFAKPFPRWFYSGMNTIRVNRAQRDSSSVRQMLDRLRRGRVVGMFPEGNVRSIADSVLRGGKIRPGVGRLAKLANVPIIPAVIVNADMYTKVDNWLPLKRVWYGIIYGQPLEIDPKVDPELAAEELEQRMCARFLELHDELRQACRDKYNP